jgi:hypothetical protein
VDEGHGVDGPLCWEVHPLRQEKASKSLSLIVIVATVSWSTAYSFGHFGYGLLSLCVLVLSMAHYFFPSRYKLDEIGVSRDILGRQTRRMWTEFRRVDTRSNGLFLSPFARPSRLDSFRGFFLPFHAEGDQVVYYVQQHVDLRAD